MISADLTLGGLRLLVTGGTGFLGSAFVRRAVGGNADVSVIAREASDHWRLTPVAGGYATITAPLTELDRLPADRVGRPDVMVHFAATGVDQSFDDVATLTATNVAGTVQALQLAQRLGVSRFVLVGTSGEYGPGARLGEDAPLRPTSEYGATRAAATLLAQAFGARRGLDVVVVRPFAVYGPYEAPYRLVPYCILRGLASKVMHISSGVQTRDYVHVDDVAEGIVRACKVASARGGIFNLCTGVETTVCDAAKLIAELTGGGSPIAAGSREAIAGEMWRTSGDPACAWSSLRWSPRWDLAAGFRHTVTWFREIGRMLPAYRAAPPD